MSDEQEPRVVREGEHRLYRVTFIDQVVLELSAATSDHAVLKAARFRNGRDEETAVTKVERSEAWIARETAKFRAWLDANDVRVFVMAGDA